MLDLYCLRRALLAACFCASVSNAAIQPSGECVSTGPREARKSEAACYSTSHAGLGRTLRIYAPAHRRGVVPLVFVIHGGGGTGGNMEWLTRRGFNRIADRDGAVIVYPDGIGKGWNDGRTEVKSEAVRKQIDDLGYLRVLPQALAAQFPIDLTRVYATGISNGGMMSYRLACDAADVFAAVAPVAANISVELAPRCRPSRPVAIAVVNGTDDPLVPWNGGPIKVLWTTRGVVLSTPQTVARWRTLNRCGELETIGTLVDAVPDDGTALLEQTARCAQETEVKVYEIRGGGHTWPNGMPYLGERLVGRVSRELDANEAIWRFFARFRLTVPASASPSSSGQ